MIVSQRGIEFLKKEEGCVLRVYLDQVGKPTIGYGHLLTAAENRSGAFARGMSKAEAEELLRKDLAVKAEVHVNDLVTVPLTQGQFDALCSLVFNIGPGKDGFGGSTLLRLLNAGDYDGAREQFAVWRMGGKKVLDVLVRRRAREQKLWDSVDCDLAAG